MSRNQALGGLTGHQHAASSAGGAGSAGESGRRSSSSRSVLGAALRLVREEGLRGLLRGVEVQVVRGCLGAGEWCERRCHLPGSSGANYVVKVW